MARVNVSDAVWVEFRSACLTKGEHVADALARLVVRDLSRSASRERRNRDRGIDGVAGRMSSALTLFDPDDEQELRTSRAEGRGSL